VPHLGHRNRGGDRHDQPLKLPFDTGREMIDGLRPWIETEARLCTQGAVNRMMDLVQQILAPWARGVETHPGGMGFGIVCGPCPHPRAGEGGILALWGIWDTVHPVPRCQKLGRFRREGGICYGPGLMDIEGRQNYVSRRVAQIAGAGDGDAAARDRLFTRTKRLGTTVDRWRLIEAEAKRHKYIFWWPDPPCPGRGGRDSVAMQLRGLTLQTASKPTRGVGRLKDGVSAIAEMAKHVAVIEGMTSRELYLLAGRVQTRASG